MLSLPDGPNQASLFQSPVRLKLLQVSAQCVAPQGESARTELEIGPALRWCRLPTPMSETCIP